MDKLASKFVCSTRAEDQFRFTGIDVSMSDKGIKMNQNKYLIEVIVIDKKGHPKRELTKEEFTKFRKATGKLSWLSETSRPDLAYNVLLMTYKNKNAKVEDLKEMNKIIIKAKQEPSEVLFSRIVDFDEIKNLVISDGSYLKLEDKTRSVGGRFIFLSNKDEIEVRPQMWKC